MMFPRHPAERTGHSPRTPWWASCLLALVLTVVGVTAVTAAWHAEHDSDANCVVCKLRHHSVAELSGAPLVSHIEAPQPTTRTTAVAWIRTDADALVPTRAPPQF